MADGYEETLDRWTRAESLYVGLDSILFVHATFHSPEFRRAFAVRHPDVYGPGSEEVRRLLLTDADAEQYLEFFVSAATSDVKWNDFERPDSIWRVTLEGDAGARVDGSAQRIKTTANVRAIYPYITDFARTYSVRFPRSTDDGQPVITGSTSRFALRFGSALGSATLVWFLAP